LAIANKDNSNTSDSDIIRRIFWFASVIIRIMHESKAIATDNKSLSIYEGLVNSAFIMSDFDTDSVSRETVCFDNEIR
jgi:hypothetical protein